MLYSMANSNEGLRYDPMRGLAVSGAQSYKTLCCSQKWEAEDNRAEEEASGKVGSCQEDAV